MLDRTSSDKLEKNTGGYLFEKVIKITLDKTCPRNEANATTAERKKYAEHIIKA